MTPSETPEQAAISKYIAEKGTGAKHIENSLYMLSNTPGKGKAVASGDNVEVKYKGMFLDGRVFDQSANHGGKGTFSFVYSADVPLIQGWIKVIGNMCEGEKLTVLIPSWLAYGQRGAGGLIPGNTPLLFDIEVVKVG
ncbi:MAG: FKBP-type peptidyl-prolyl cis-trans isomerase [Bacteroidia bacterium]